MVTNAFEETEKGGEVRMWAESSENKLEFCVWNKKAIPQDVSMRIFQRNFSTKGQTGRGSGTYSMKFFGEEVLGGTVSFTTSAQDGTVFRFGLDVQAIS